MSKHTPGPWYRAGHLIVDAKGQGVCALDDRNADANAKLIAKAPKLLELAKSCVMVGAIDTDYFGSADLAELIRELES